MKLLLTFMACLMATMGFGQNKYSGAFSSQVPMNMNHNAVTNATAFYNQADSTSGPYIDLGNLLLPTIIKNPNGLNIFAGSGYFQIANTGAVSTTNSITAGSFNGNGNGLTFNQATGSNVISGVTMTNGTLGFTGFPSYLDDFSSAIRVNGNLILGGTTNGLFFSQNGAQLDSNWSLKYTIGVGGSLINNNGLVSTIYGGGGGYGYVIKSTTGNNIFQIQGSDGQGVYNGNFTINSNLVVSGTITATNGFASVSGGITNLSAQPIVSLGGYQGNGSGLFYSNTVSGATNVTIGSVMLLTNSAGGFVAQDTAGPMNRTNSGNIVSLGGFTGNGGGLTNVTSISTVTGIHYVSSTTFSNILTGYMLGTNALGMPIMWAVSTNIISY